MLAFVLFLAGINIYVRLSVKKQIISVENATEISDVDCIVVFGASVYGDTPSLMLRDRLDKAIELYKSGVASKIIMSGDHGGEYYDEVTVMKEYAVAAGVPSEDIFKDHAGYSTYDSVYRAKEIFGARKVVLVTQDYHLYRCLFVAKKLGLDAYGVISEGSNYKGQSGRNIREVFATVKDVFMTVVKPQSEELGATIPLDSDGNITNERPNYESD